MQREHILIVDDDREIIKFIEANLRKEGWQVQTATDGYQALRLIAVDSPDLVILDIMMPGLDGVEVCRRLRTRSQVPVIMLSARGNLEDKVDCLNLGADDYLTKPFGVEELIARVRAVLRRNKPNQRLIPRTLLASGSLEIDFITRRVTCHGQEIKLTPTEYNLLQELALHAGRTLDYNYLLKRVWGPEYEIEREYLHVYIGRLRAKIEPDPKQPQYIISIPGMGYKLQKMNNP